MEPLNLLTEYRAVLEALERHLRGASRTLTVLEAGCGRKWPLEVEGLDLRIIGVDLDDAALTARQDLARAIVGDLRDPALMPPESCDVVYCAFVLEHVDGAERVLDNFLRWLRPGGLLLLRIPDRDSAYAFAARATPFRVHVLYKRWIEGQRQAGRPGFDPYPVHYDSVVSRRGVRDFCRRRGCRILEEHGSGFYLVEGRMAPLMRVAAIAIWAASFGRLAWRHNNLTYVIRKAPQPAGTAAPGTTRDTDGVAAEVLEI
jgi:SAM-dependent methyltransferase